MPTAPITFPDRNAVPSRAIRSHRAIRMTEPRWGSGSGAGLWMAGSQESTRYRSALLGCMTQVRWTWGCTELACADECSAGSRLLRILVVPRCSPPCDSMDSFFATHQQQDTGNGWLPPCSIHEPQSGSIMQPKGAEPQASAPLGR
jgi:hypothetical protein